MNIIFSRLGIRFSRGCAVLLASCAGGWVGQASLVTLVEENFSSGVGSGVVWTSSAAGVSNGQQWSWSSPTVPGPTITEVWLGTAGASARGLATTYDHDQDPLTAAVNIPGGVEVMSSAPSITTEPGQVFVVTLQLTLPALLDVTQAGTVSFFVANRISSGLGGRAPRFSMYNITDDQEILPLQILNFPLGNNQWNYKEFAIPFLAADPGDVIALRFQDQSGNGARGLEFADVSFTVNVVPEPTSIALLFFGGLMVRHLRNRGLQG